MGRTRIPQSDHRLGTRTVFRDYLSTCMAETLKTISPIDGRTYVERPLATAAGIDRALDSAQAAQPVWASLPLPARCEILGKAVDAFVAQAGDIAAAIDRKST